MDNNLLNLKEKLKGISAINITPFNSKGNIDEDKLIENINYLVEQKFELIVPCGNTGEFYSLNSEEFETITRIALSAMEDNALGLVGVGYDLKTAIKQAKYAESHGASGIMIHQPVHPHITENGLVEYYEKISNAVNIGVVLYVKSKKLTLNGFKKLKSIKNIVGVKYSLKDPFSFAQLKKELSEWEITWVCGLAESWAPFFQRAGVNSFTSGLVNIAPEKSKQMLAALKADNSEEIMKVWHDVKAFEDLRAKYEDGNNVAVVKTAMNLINKKVGDVRPPVSMLNKNDTNELIEILTSWGYLK